MPAIFPPLQDSDLQSKFIFLLLIVILSCLFLGCNSDTTVINSLSKNPSKKETIEYEQNSTRQINSAADTWHEELKAQLQEGEVLVRVQTMNLDNDENDEHLVIVTTTLVAPLENYTSTIKVLIFDFVPTESAYQRIGELRTHATDIRTFDLQIQDLTGDHRLEIIAQGVNSTGERTLNAYRLVPTHRSTTIYSSIASIVTKGTIEVSDRKISESYLSHGINAEPLQITTYTNDPHSANTTDVIRTTYIWKNENNHYENDTPEQVTGISVQAELHDLLVSTGTEQFKIFLSGPWAQISEEKIEHSDVNSLEIIHFEPDQNFITLYDGQVQEIYAWAVSYRLLPHRLGIWVNNVLVNSIEKSMNIEITDSNTIRIVMKGREKDDYTDNLYRRLSTNERHELTASIGSHYKLSSLNLSGWYFSDKGESILFDPPWFSWNSTEGSISGGFAIYSINHQIIALKIVSPAGITREFRTYTIYYKEQINGQQVLRTLLLQPTHLTIRSAETLDVPSLRFEQLKSVETMD